MRLVVYTDYAYARDGEAIYAERAFALFLARLAEHCDVTIVGRERSTSEPGRYLLPEAVEFVGLPHYESLADPVGVVRAMRASLGRFWRALDDADACWLLGPHPLAIAFAGLAALRRRCVILGVRQDLPSYTRTRHPGRSGLTAAASALDLVYRALARRCRTVVVGPALRGRYGRAPRLLEIAVSLIGPDDVVSEEQAIGRDYQGERRILSVGRIDEEKNPLMLAEVLARLSGGEPGWRLVVCGEGPLEAALGERLRSLGLADRAELRGYVLHSEMRDVYRSSHFLLHTSWTEGLPQVIVEALAAGLPVVTTDVGGIAQAVGSQVELVPAGDVERAAARLQALAEDAERRAVLQRSGLAYAGAHTLDAEVERVARFLAD